MTERKYLVVGNRHDYNGGGSPPTVTFGCFGLFSVNNDAWTFVDELEAKDQYKDHVAYSGLYILKVKSVSC